MSAMSELAADLGTRNARVESAAVEYIAADQAFDEVCRSEPPFGTHGTAERNVWSAWYPAWESADRRHREALERFASYMRLDEMAREIAQRAGSPVT